MLDIQQRIVTFLEQSHKVTLPGIGLIRYTYQPAEILRYTRRILPPRFKIEFVANADEPISDFIQYLCKVDNISESEAQASFNTFLTQMKEQLAGQKIFHIPQLGTFKYVDKGIVFEEDRDSVLLAYNVGLKDVNLPMPPSSNTSKETTLIPSTSSPKTTIHVPHSGIPGFVKIGLALAVAIIALFFIVAHTDISNSVKWQKVMQSAEKWIAEISFFSKTNSKTLEQFRQSNREALSIKQQHAIDTISVQSSVISKNNVSKQLVYHIIAGSFKNKTNALHCMKSLQNMGFSPSVLTFGDTLFRVSLVSFPDRQKAVDEYIRITQLHPNLKIWFYSRYE